MKTKDIRKTGSLPVWLWVIIFLVAIPAAIKMPILTWTILGALWALKGYTLLYPNEFETKRSQRVIWVEAFICGPIVFGFHAIVEGFQWLMFYDMAKDRQISPHSSVEPELPEIGCEVLKRFTDPEWEMKRIDPYSSAE